MERKIGEVFEYQGKKLKVVEAAKDLCFDCYFFDGVYCQRTEQESGECSILKRDDYKSVIFVEVKDYQPQEQRDWAKVKYEKKKEKFDPKTLKAYDKVLVQDNGLWNITFFAFYNEMDKMCICSAFGIYKHCIPYNDKTKHLVGTKDEAPEYYRYWED